MPALVRDVVGEYLFFDLRQFAGTFIHVFIIARYAARHHWLTFTLSGTRKLAQNAKSSKLHRVEDRWVEDSLNGEARIAKPNHNPAIIASI